MGNSPTQKPFEDDSSKPGAEAAGTSLSERVVSAVRSVATTVRSKCSVFSNLDFAGAFRVVEEDVTEGDDTGTASNTGSQSTIESFPARDQPFTHPVRDRDVANPPDLEASEADETDEIAIYYPDRPTATITSDTWEQVER
jgi:hypothetical protein